MSSEDNTATIKRMIIAGPLAWLVPGLGHIFLGDRSRGLICLAAITATFWTGVAIGGVRGTVDPRARQLWFVAQLGTGGNALSAYLLNAATARSPTTSGGKTEPAPVVHWASTEVGVHYTGVAGLLNLLVIFDCLARAELRGPGRKRVEAFP